MRVTEQTPASGLHCAVCRAVQGASSKVISDQTPRLSRGSRLLQPLGHARGWGTVTQGHSTWPRPAPGLCTKDPLSPPEGQGPVCCAGCWLSEARTAQGGWLEGFCQELSLVSRGLISCAGNTHVQATHAEVKKERFYWAIPVGEKRTQRHSWDAPRAFLLRSARQQKLQKAVTAFL